jgi:hypothetical protein
MFITFYTLTVQNNLGYALESVIGRGIPLPYILSGKIINLLPVEVTRGDLKFNPPYLIFDLVFWFCAVYGAYEIVMGIVQFLRGK